MTKQTISTGTVANDGSGDTIRGAMLKTNSNFTELYSSLGDGTTLKSFGVNVEFNTVNDGRILYYSGVSDTINGSSVNYLINDDQYLGINTHFFRDNVPAYGPVLRLERAKGVVANPLYPSNPLPINGDELLGEVQIRSYNNASQFVDSGSLSWTATTSAGDANFSLKVSYGSSMTELLGSFGGQVRVSGAYTLPNVAGTSGDSLTSDGAGGSSWVANISLAQFKAVVAASTDFADFQTRVAAL